MSWHRHMWSCCSIAGQLSCLSISAVMPRRSALQTHVPVYVLCHPFRTPADCRPLTGCCCGCSIAGRLVRQFTELRQCCCHPQIVRTSDSMLGRDRLSMQDIMARLTSKAYMEYDQAARAHVTARLLQEAVALPAGHRPSK